MTLQSHQPLLSFQSTGSSSHHRASAQANVVWNASPLPSAPHYSGLRPQLKSLFLRGPTLNPFSSALQFPSEGIARLEWCSGTYNHSFNICSPLYPPALSSTSRTRSGTEQALNKYFLSKWGRHCGQRLEVTQELGGSRGPKGQVRQEERSWQRGSYQRTSTIKTPKRPSSRQPNGRDETS